MIDGMHTFIADPRTEVAAQPGAVVSKVVHRGDGLNVTVFGFDAGEGLTEHTSTRQAVVQVLSGRLQFTVDGETRTPRSCSLTVGNFVRGRRQ